MSCGRRSAGTQPRASTRLDHPAELGHVEGDRAQPERGHRGPVVTQLSDHLQRQAVRVHGHAVDVAGQLRVGQEHAGEGRRRIGQAADQHASPGHRGADGITGGDVHGRVGGRIRAAVPELPVVGLIPDLDRADGMGAELGMCGPERPSGSVAADQRGRVGRVVRVAPRRSVPGLRCNAPAGGVVDDRQPAEVMRGQGSGDAIVKAPVVGVHPADRRLRLGELPQGVAAGHRHPGGANRAELGVDLGRGVGAVVEQPVDVEAEGDAGRRREGGG